VAPSSWRRRSAGRPADRTSGSCVEASKPSTLTILARTARSIGGARETASKIDARMACFCSSCSRPSEICQCLRRAFASAGVSGGSADSLEIFAHEIWALSSRG
jgi:hypothetical protein